MDRNPTEPPDELSQEELAQQKTRTRINALALALVLIIAAVAPQPWNLFAPLLFLLPLLHSLVLRIRSRTVTLHGDLYSYRPKDSKDLRRYRPIE